MDAQAEMLTLASDPPKRPPPPVDRLRARVDEFVASLRDEFPQEMVARALMCKGTDLILDANGIFAVAHAVSRVQDLACGFWTPETTNIFIESYR